MATVYFITHPEVAIDPVVPAPDWPLSAVGLRRMRAAVACSWHAGVQAIFASTERKAREAASVLAEKRGLVPIILADLGENDRSATGYLPKPAFEAMADDFFARPEVSVHGWERATDAQRRIIGAVDRVIALSPAQGDIAIISHGGVGALLLCHLKGVPINRSEDQPGGGGGNVYSFDSRKRGLIAGWRPIEWAPTLP